MKKSIGKKVSMKGKKMNTAGLKKESSAVIEMKGTGYRDAPRRETTPNPSAGTGVARRTTPVMPMMSNPQRTITRDYTGHGNNPFWRDAYISRQVK